MKISIIGTGAVGQTIASKLVELNHNVIVTMKTHLILDYTLTGYCLDLWLKSNQVISKTFHLGL